MFTNWFKKLITTLLIIFISVFIIYQFNKFLFTEDIVFDDIKIGEIKTVKGKHFNLQGATNNVKNIYINEKEYFLNENDRFNIELNLFKGQNNFKMKLVLRDNTVKYIEFCIYREE